MAKLFVKTYGCTLNKKDTDKVISDNFFTEDILEIKKCNYVLINTCGVKEQTQTKIINFLEKLKTLKIPQENIIVFGCLVNIDKESLLNVLPNAKYFTVENEKEILNIIGNKEEKIDKKKNTEIIIISNGCLGNCSYCAVKFARGKLKSRPVNEIVREVKEVLKNKNVNEILLTSQDNACYGKDINTNLVVLLKKLVKIKRDFKIRNGMGNPQHIKPILKELIEVYKNEKIYKFLHIPIQSGDNNVLKEMNRNYTIEDVYEIIKYFRKEIRDITISTDVIVGYPTETDKQFLETIKAIKKIKPVFVNISRFGQRKGIDANKYKDLSGNIKKERSRKLTKLCEEISLNENKKEKNKIKEILIIEKGKNNSYVGKTNDYKSVVVFKKLVLGKKYKVKIIDANNYYLTGKLINPNDSL